MKQVERIDDRMSPCVPKVWQFLRSKGPRIGMLRRFAAAADVPLHDVINGPERLGMKMK